MKIAFLNIYHNINSRGAESFANDLATRLSRRHEVYMFSGAPPKDSKKYKSVVIKGWVSQPTSTFSKNPISSLRKRLFLDNASLSILLFSLKVAPKLWKKKFDVIRPTNGFWQVLICKVITFFRGGKIIIRGGSGPGWDERWNLYLTPDVFIATTPEVRDWAKKTAPWVDVQMIPLAIDIERFKKAKPAKIDLEHPIILCNAAADTYKRVDLAIMAVAKLEKGSLLHLGKGEDLEKIKTLGLELLGEKRFKSMVVPHDEVPKVFKAASIVTLPSMEQESFGIVFLEAMASHKLVVATDAPRPRWILGPGGLFVDPTNIDKYAQKLTQALKAKTNWKKVDEHLVSFSWETVANEYEDLLEQHMVLSLGLLGTLL